MNRPTGWNQGDGLRRPPGSGPLENAAAQPTQRWARQDRDDQPWAWDDENQRWFRADRDQRWARQDRDQPWAFEDRNQRGLRADGRRNYSEAVTNARRHRRDTGLAGAEGNAKLTAMTGAVLLIGFAVEGITILNLHQLLAFHFVVGFLLIGPVLLKMSSTMYRFARYYSGSAPYVRKGPPSPVLRLLGPFVILTSVAVIGTGVALGLSGPADRGGWLFLHKASFVLWFGVMTIHVLNYAPRLPGMLAARPGRVRDGRHGSGGPDLFAGPARWLALAASLAVGIGIAAVGMHLSGKWGLSL